MKKVFLVLMAVLVVPLGCAPGVAPTPTEVAPTPTSTFVQATPSYSVEITKDIEYLKLLEPDAPVLTLDIYAPTESGPWPVLVVDHGGFQSKDNSMYANFAEELAGRGVVVFVPDRRTPCAILRECLADNGRDIREIEETYECGFRFARERAADYGGDPSRLTVFGDDSAGLAGAFIGDGLQQAWEEVVSGRGGPPPQTDCLAVEDSARVDAFMSYGGSYDFYDEAEETDPDLWALASYYGLMGRSPSLVIRLVHGGLANPEYIENGVALNAALVNAGYDATHTLLGDVKWEIPWSGPYREELIQMTLDLARG